MTLAITEAAAPARRTEFRAELRGVEADPSLFRPISGAGIAVNAVDPCVAFGILRR